MLHPLKKIKFFFFNFIQSNGYYTFLFLIEIANLKSWCELKTKCVRCKLVYKNYCHFSP